MIRARWRHLAAVLLSLGAAALVGTARADTLVANVNGITLDERGQVQRFSALLFGRDGKVKALYQAGDKRPKADYLVDGRGRTLLPGFVDSHVDVLALGFAALTREAGADPALALPPPRAIDRDAAFERAQKLLLARGITAVADMGTSIEEWQTFRRAGDVGRLKLRIMSYADGNAAMVLIGGPAPTPWLYGDRLRLNGVLLILDGPIDTRAAWLNTHYGDAPGERGKPLLNQTQLGNLMSRAAMDGFQVAVAVNGDAAFRSVLEAIAELAPTYRGDRRWRIEGAGLVDPADLGQVRASGVVASMRPVDVVRSGLEASLGPNRLAGSHAWRSLAAAGAALAFGSGAPQNAPDPFGGLAAAITRENAAGQPFGGWQPQERIGRTEALAAYTVGGAYAGGAEQRFGRLAPGLRADFVLVDTDPLLANAAQLRRAQVLETWIGGERVFAADERGASDALSR